jgi:hypothetical protein
LRDETSRVAAPVRPSVCQDSVDNDFDHLHESEFFVAQRFFPARFSASAQNFGCDFVAPADSAGRAVRESIRKKMPFWPVRRG